MWVTGEKEEKNEREEKKENKEKKFLPADGQVAQDTRSTNPHDYSGPHWIILDTLDSFGPDMEFVKFLHSQIFGLKILHRKSA